MLIAPIVNQVATVAALKRVSGSASFAAAQVDTIVTPCAYVLPLADTANPNRMLSGAVEQRVSERFGVVLAITNARDARGARANDDLEAIRAAVITALLGWQPASGYDPVEYGGGRMLALTNYILWWQLEFATAYFERKV